MDDLLKKSMFKYYDERAPEYDEIYLYGKKHNLKMEIHHFGLTFCAFSGKLRDAAKG